ncbi:hypothetical protein Zm00014a_009944 [Zea mays]|uniref:Uncharacterized protein n=3 Tax=Zea mays TaxID=4577 RepID=A0A317YCM2_MAIZE|nr:hypothetical protein Zm00014a_009944 [Zea mays]
MGSIGIKYIGIGYHCTENSNPPTLAGINTPIHSLRPLERSSSSWDASAAATQASILLGLLLGRQCHRHPGLHPPRTPAAGAKSSLPSRMDILEGSIAVRGRGKNKRKWIPVEDDELIKALVDVSLDPRWRSDGSFKNGYTSVLEARLAEKLPDSKISATPHIESRLRYFKTKYSALEQMLNKSGFTWDPTKKMIQCEKQQYETHCKNNPDAKGLYGVSFPYYDELSMVYSKDMATGEGAEDMTDVVQNLEEELVRVNANDEEDGEDMTSVETPRRSVDSTSSSSKKRKKEWKGKKTSSSDPLLDVFNEVSGDLKVATMLIGKMAQAMDREASNQEKARDEDPQQKLREKAINEVRRLEFTGSEVIKAAGVFVRMPDQMGMLFALPEPLRRKYIVDMLRGN